MPTAPICLRVSEDIDVAVDHIAEQQGVSKSEWVRQLIHAAIYGDAPGVDQGYLQGRTIGYRVAIEAMRSTFGENPFAMPQTVEEGMRLLQTIKSLHG